MKTSLARAGVRSPLGAALDLLGDQWTLLILQSVFLRVRRYSEIKDRLGIADAVLAARLRALLGAGLLEQLPYRDGQRTRAEYHLTERGLALWSMLIAIWAWERRWVASRESDLPELSHQDCGTTVPRLACARCGQPVSAHDTTVERAEGVRLAAASQARRFRRQGWERISDKPLLFFPHTMEILGDRWATGIIAAAFLRIHRFADFERELGIAPSVLSERLARLVDLGILATTRSRHLAGASEYHLTDKGLAFFPVFEIIVFWASTYLPGDPGIRVLHGDHGLVPALQCDRCHRLLSRRAVHFTL